MSSRRFMMGDYVPSDKNEGELMHVRELKGDLPPWYNPAQFSVWHKRWVRELEYQRLLHYRGYQNKQNVNELRHPGMSFGERISCFFQNFNNFSAPPSLGLHGPMLVSAGMRNIFPLFHDLNITVEDDEEEQVPVQHKHVPGKAEAKPLMPDFENLRISAKISTNVFLSWTWSWDAARQQRNLSAEEAEELMTSVKMVEVRIDGTERGEFMCEQDSGWGTPRGLQGLWLDCMKEGNHTVCLRVFRAPPRGYSKNMRGAWSSAIKFQVIPFYRNVSRVEDDNSPSARSHSQSRAKIDKRKLLVWEQTKDAISMAEKAEIMQGVMKELSQELSLPLPDVSEDLVLDEEQEALLKLLSNQSETLHQSFVSHARALERSRNFSQEQTYDDLSSLFLRADDLGHALREQLNQNKWRQEEPPPPENVTVSWTSPGGNTTASSGDGLQLFAVEEEELWLIRETDKGLEEMNVTLASSDFTWQRKPRSCDFYMRNGFCLNGKTCRFLHSGRPARSSLQRAMASVLNSYPNEFEALRGEDSELEEEDLDQLMLLLGQDYPGWYLTRDRVAKLVKDVLPSIRKKRRKSSWAGMTTRMRRGRDTRDLGEASSSQAVDEAENTDDSFSRSSHHWP